VRLTPNGAVDPSFGSGGRALTAPKVRIAALHFTRPGELLALVASEAQRFGIVRYTTVGTPANATEAGRIDWLTSATSSRDAAAVIDSTGRIDLFAEDASGSAVLARYLPSGAPDPGFGASGSLRLPLFNGAESVALASERDGAILIGALGRRAQLAQITPHGTLDRAFGNGGSVALPLRHSHHSGPPSSLAIAVSARGRIVAAANEASVSQQPHAQALLLASFTPSGALQRSFAHTGVTRTHLARAGRFATLEPKAITFDQRGDIIVAGERPEPRRDSPSGEWFLARYTPRGRDCSFGANGVMLSGVTGGANSVAVQPDGHILIAGWGETSGGGPSLMVARYRDGGMTPTCR
jgi:uncharacterized delta-60 repeat protein